MGSWSSKQRSSRPSTGSPSSRGGGRMRYGRLFGDLLGESSTSQGGSGRGWRSSSARGHEVQPLVFTQGETWEDDDEGVGCPVRPQKPLTPLYYKKAIDISWFLKEKGGLRGIYYSKRRHDLLNIYMLNEQGVLDDWQHYTDGPGERYPLTFGWLWKLVPVQVNVEDDDEHMLMHPAVQDGMEDPWGEILAWDFDPTLAWEAGRIKAAKQKKAQEAMEACLEESEEE
uniref:Protein Nef n=1 Tax=Simian immunodeficiency virus TaxID=11723 RepID=E1VCY3_SIV|nr:Nef protein [Simian immunodeficiency virus]